MRTCVHERHKNKDICAGTKKKKKRLQTKREERANREEVRDGRLLLLLLGRRSDLLESREGLQWRRDALYKRVTKSAVFCLFFSFFF